MILDVFPTLWFTPGSEYPDACCLRFRKTVKLWGLFVWPCRHMLMPKSVLQVHSLWTYFWLLAEVISLSLRHMLVKICLTQLLYNWLYPLWFVIAGYLLDRCVARRNELLGENCAANLSYTADEDALKTWQECPNALDRQSPQHWTRSHRDSRLCETVCNWFACRAVWVSAASWPNRTRILMGVRHLYDNWRGVQRGGGPSYVIWAVSKAIPLQIKGIGAGPWASAPCRIRPRQASASLSDKKNASLSANWRILDSNRNFTTWFWTTCHQLP